MKSIMTLALKLFIITIIAGALLGATYAITKEPIAHQAIKEADEARHKVISATEFQQIGVSQIVATDPSFDIVKSVHVAYNNGEVAGIAIAVSAKGYSPGLNLTVGVNMDGVVTAISVGANEETPGLGAKAGEPEFYTQFENKTAPLGVIKAGIPKGNEILAISGATITSKAVAGAVNTCINLFNALKEGGLIE